MGRAARWIRGLLLGGKKVGEPTAEKRRWGFGKSYREKQQQQKHHHHQPRGEEVQLPVPEADAEERSKRAIAVAAATAAVAEAAVAAAQAAAAVVRLTASGGRAERKREEERAAVKIQSAFRGYLARRALKALRGLVKLQALVRGNIVRKQAAETLRCMQALVRVQARARACRALCSARSHPPAKASRPRTRVSSATQFPTLCSPNPPTDEDYERAVRPIASDRSFTLKRNSSKVEVDRAFLWDDDRKAGRKITNFSPAGDEKNAKIMEVDLECFSHFRKKINHHYHSGNSRSFTTVLASPSKDSSGESPFLHYGTSSLKQAADEECAQSLWSDYMDCCPSYMANTESSRAKLRSYSAPRQRPEVEKQGPVVKRSSAHGGGQLPPLLPQRSASSSSSSSLHAKFTNKAYPGSGRLDRLGMPVRI